MLLSKIGVMGAILSFLLLVVLILLPAGSGLTMTIQQAQQQQAQLQQQIDQAQTGVSSAQVKAAAALSQLNADNQVLAVIAGKLSQVQTQEAVTQGDLQRTTAQLAILRTKLDQQQGLLGERLQLMYEYGGVSYLDVLLGSSSFSDFLTRFDNLQRIIGGDVNLLHLVQSQRDAAFQEESLLATQTAQEQGLVAQAQTQENLAASEVASRRQVLNSLQNDVAARKALLGQLEATQAQVTAIISQLESGKGNASSLASVHFVWPADGPITRPFGENYDPILKVMAQHTGIDIGVGFGYPVLAAAAGKVIYSGFMTGYGNTVIIDHGNGVSTLYAHAEKILVSQGVQVVQGQNITLAGATGYATGPHLHFEIRLNGTPVDPILYLPLKGGTTPSGSPVSPVD